MALSMRRTCCGGAVQVVIVGFSAILLAERPRQTEGLEYFLLFLCTEMCVPRLELSLV